MSNLVVSSPPTALNLPGSELRQRAADIRRLVLETVIATGEGHIGAALSVADILAALYFGELRVSADVPRHPDRDRFILSKGHASLALYSTLALRGFIRQAELRTCATLQSRLGGHPDRHKVPGVEASTGSLGHGIGLAVGMAFATRREGSPKRVFCLLGDGESQEGSVWEAALVGPQLGLDNLTVIVDANDQQGMGPIDPTIASHPLDRKFRAFGWETLVINGHDTTELRNAFSSLPLKSGVPTAIVARTIKGKGITFMENVPIWHYRAPNSQEAEIARAQLGGEWKGWEDA